MPLEDDSADLVFMSQVFTISWTGEPPWLKSVAFFETTAGWRFDKRRWKTWTPTSSVLFPQARTTHGAGLPPRNGLVELRSRAATGSSPWICCDSEIAQTSDEYIGKIGLRTDSDWESIWTRRSRLACTCWRPTPPASPNYPKSAENDLLVFVAE